MAKGVVFDCFSGASGDMLLGALFDVGVDMKQLRDGLKTLPVAGWSLTAEPARQHGVGGTRARVELRERDQPDTHDCRRCCASSAMPGCPTK